MEKRSFFERLTGSVKVDTASQKTISIKPTDLGNGQSRRAAIEPVQEEEAQLTVDVFQTPDEIVVQTIVAGIKPEELVADTAYSGAENAAEAAQHGVNLLVLAAV